jgi:arsenite-transporting ATPase
MSGLFARRVVLVTGKGGVGKTTVTAALARVAARAGKRVLAAEISYESQRPDDEHAAPHDAASAARDAAASSPLAAAFGTEPFVDEPRRIESLGTHGGIWGARMSPFAGHVQFLRDNLPVRLLADAAMRSAAVRRFFSAAPTLAELGIVYRLLDLLDRTRPGGGPEWDVMLCDLPATGHALALAQVPQTLADVIRAGPIHTAAERGLTLLRDPERTTSVLVTLPEPLPVSEAIELHDGLHKLAIGCGLVLLNRVPPNPFSPEERAAAERIVPDRIRTLGARRLPRIDRADTARERLRRELKLGVESILESPNGDVTAHVTSQLSGTLAGRLAGTP